LLSFSTYKNGKKRFNQHDWNYEEKEDNNTPTNIKLTLRNGIEFKRLVSFLSNDIDNYLEQAGDIEHLSILVKLNN
jgi:hypothetical protein